jgi:hypothetical protein
MLKTVKTNLLKIAYDEQGSSSGWPGNLCQVSPCDIPGTMPPLKILGYFDRAP